jgi:hypothetical protein
VVENDQNSPELSQGVSGVPSEGDRPETAQLDTTFLSKTGNSEPVKKRKPWSSKQRKYNLPKRTAFDLVLLPILQNLTAVGMTESDIGAIVGFQGKHSEDWLNELKRNHPEVKDACRVGKEIADSFLVAQMYRTAVGYDYAEIEEIYELDGEGNNVQVGAKRKIKHQPANPQMAMFMACNRMPELFKNRVEQTKKSFIISTNGELSGNQIERLAGLLLEESEKLDIIDAQVVETKELEIENDGSQ